MEIGNRITFLIGSLLLCIIPHVTCIAPTLTLYSEYNYTGNSLTVTRQVYDLIDFNFDDLTKSVCGSGIWILYEKAKFNENSDFIYEFIGGEYKCEDLSTSVANTVSSVRYPGADDVFENSLTMYVDHYMANGEYLVLRDVAYLFTFDDKASSFAIVGNESWTLYEDPDYDGISFCLIPGDYDGYYYGLWEPEDLPLHDNRVSAVAKGCFSPMIFQYERKIIKE